MPDQIKNTDLLQITGDIAASYVANNKISRGELADLIQTVFDTLVLVARRGTGLSDKVMPAVLPEHSIFPDYLICLEDGKKLKMLKRHLKSAYNLTPDEYRARWGLPPSYPMVAPNYAQRRSELAKDIGLGNLPNQRRKKSA